MGAPRCGTTSLYEYLKNTPNFFMCPIKEPNYFSISIDSSTLYYNHTRKKEDYLKLFKHTNNALAIGEASPQYLRDPKAPNFIHENIPNAKIIIILRNPVERAFSHYLLRFGSGSESLSFKKTMQKALDANEDDDFARRIYVAGMYSEQVQRYVEIFGKSNIKILIFEEFIKDTWNSVKDIITFLGLKENPPESVSEVHNTYTEPRNNMFKMLLRNNSVRQVGKTVFPFYVQNFIMKKLISKKGIKQKMTSDENTFVRNLYVEDVKKLSKILNRELPWGF